MGKSQNFYFNVGVKAFWVFRAQTEASYSLNTRLCSGRYHHWFSWAAFQAERTQDYEWELNILVKLLFHRSPVFLMCWLWCLNQPCLRIGSDASKVFEEIFVRSISHHYTKAPTLYMRGVCLGSVFKYFTDFKFLLQLCQLFAHQCVWLAFISFFSVSEVLEVAALASNYSLVFRPNWVSGYESVLLLLGSICRLKGEMSENREPS